MNDGSDPDRDEQAELLLRETIDNLLKSASASLKDPGLSVWHHGRVLHGQHLLNQSSDLIDLVRSICKQARSPHTTQSLLNAINSLVIAAFKIGQGAEKPEDQKQHEKVRRTEVGRKASILAAGRQSRLHVISDFVRNNPELKSP